MRNARVPHGEALGEPEAGDQAAGDPETDGFVELAPVERELPGLVRRAQEAGDTFTLLLLRPGTAPRRGRPHERPRTNDVADLTAAVAAALPPDSQVFEAGRDYLAVVLGGKSRRTALRLANRVAGCGAPTFTWVASRFPRDARTARGLVQVAARRLDGRGRAPVPNAPGAGARAGRTGAAHLPSAEAGSTGGADLDVASLDAHSGNGSSPAAPAVEDPAGETRSLRPRASVSLPADTAAGTGADIAGADAAAADLPQAATTAVHTRARDLAAHLLVPDASVPKVTPVETSPADTSGDTPAPTSIGTPAADPAGNGAAASAGTAAAASVGTAAADPWTPPFTTDVGSADIPGGETTTRRVGAPGTNGDGVSRTHRRVAAGPRATPPGVGARTRRPFLATEGLDGDPLAASGDSAPPGPRSLSSEGHAKKFWAIAAALVIVAGALFFADRAAHRSGSLGGNSLDGGGTSGGAGGVLPGSSSGGRGANGSGNVGTVLSGLAASGGTGAQPGSAAALGGAQPAGTPGAVPGSAAAGSAAGGGASGGLSGGGGGGSGASGGGSGGGTSTGGSSGGSAPPPAPSGGGTSGSGSTSGSGGGGSSGGSSGGGTVTTSTPPTTAPPAPTVCLPPLVLVGTVCVPAL